MNRHIAALFYLLVQTTIIIAHEVIFIMGPSCSGKSTLAQEVVHHLGPDWTLVAYDSIEEEMKQINPKTSGGATKKEIFSLLIKEINSCLEQKNVIVDTNTFYMKMCASLRTQEIKHIFIYAPLTTLLARDSVRTNDLNRAPHHAKYARKFVEHTFYRFYPRGVPENVNITINTESLSKQAAVAHALCLITTTN